MQDRIFCVYIMSSKNDSTLYIGMTNNLFRRVTEHKEHAIKGFSEKYNTIRLVYYEVAPSAYSAILREKQLKKWSRVKKDKLIDSFNPERRDLFIDLEKEY